MRRLLTPFAAMFATVSIVASCQALLDGASKVTEPATENVFRLILSLGAGFLTWLFLPLGEIARFLVALFVAYVVQAATTERVPIQNGPGSTLPWYIDPSQWVRLGLSWLAVAVVLGLLWPRSRQQTIAALGELFSIPPHPIRAGRRFLAGLGFLHSDPVPPKDKQRAKARLTEDRP